MADMLYQAQSFREKIERTVVIYSHRCPFVVIISIRIVMSRATPTDAAIDPLLSAMFLT